MEDLPYFCTLVGRMCSILFVDKGDHCRIVGRDHDTRMVNKSYGFCYFKLLKAFLKFYRRHSALVEKYSVSLKTLLQHGISELEFYGDLVYRFRKIVGKSNFSEQFRKLINRYKSIGLAWILCGRLHA